MKLVYTFATHSRQGFQHKEQMLLESIEACMECSIERGTEKKIEKSISAEELPYKRYYHY